MRKSVTQGWGIVPAALAAWVAMLLLLPQPASAQSTPLRQRLAQLDGELLLLGSHAKNLLQFASAIAPDRSGVGMQRDPMRTAQTFELAKTHLHLGDSGRSLEIVQTALLKLDRFDARQTLRFYKLGFEASRQLRMHPEATRFCLTALSLPQSFASPSEELWLTSCALSAARAVFKQPALVQNISLTEFKAFAYAARVRQASKLSLVRAFLLATGFHALGRDEEALHYLQSALDQAPLLDPWRPRAVLAQAILYDRKGAAGEAQKLFRYLAGDLDTARFNLVPLKVDPYTAAFAKIHLARSHAKKSQLAAASRWYEDVLQGVVQAKPATSHSTHDASPLDSAEGPVIDGLASLLQGPDRHKHFPLEEVRWESALVTFQRGLIGESIKAYEPLLQKELSSVRGQGSEEPSDSLVIPRIRAVRTSLLYYARALNHEQGTSQKAVSLLTPLLKTADAELRFVVSQFKSSQSSKGKGKPAADDLALRSRALLEVAAALGASQSTHVRQLATLLEALDGTEAHKNRLEQQLALALSPADAAHTGVLESRGMAAFAALRKLQDSLWQAVLVADSLSVPLWNVPEPMLDDQLRVSKGNNTHLGQATVRSVATAHRAELLRQVAAFDDKISQVVDKSTASANSRMHESLRASVGSVAVTLNFAHASLAGTRYLASGNYQAAGLPNLAPNLAPAAPQQPNSATPSAIENTQDIIEASQQLRTLRQDLTQQVIAQRLLKLQSVFPFDGLSRERSRMVLMSRILRELSSLHSRMRRHAQGESDEAFFGAVDSTWKHVLGVQARLLNTAEGLLGQIEREREGLNSEVREIIKVAEIQTRALAALRKSVGKDLAVWLPKAAEALEPAARESRNAVRVALGDGDVRREVETSAALTELERLRIERRHWMRSLRESIMQGLAR